MSEIGFWVITSYITAGIVVTFSSISVIRSLFVKVGELSFSSVTRMITSAVSELGLLASSSVEITSNV